MVCLLLELAKIYCDATSSNNYYDWAIDCLLLLLSLGVSTSYSGCGSDGYRANSDLISTACESPYTVPTAVYLGMVLLIANELTDSISSSLILAFSSCSYYFRLLSLSLSFSLRLTLCLSLWCWLSYSWRCCWVWSSGDEISSSYAATEAFIVVSLWWLCCWLRMSACSSGWS